MCRTNPTWSGSGASTPQSPVSAAKVAGTFYCHMFGCALLGALAGLLCCSPGLLVGLWAATDGTGLWQLLFIWWAPGVSHGVFVTVPLAIALERPPIAVAVAFLASAGGYFAALWLTPSDGFGMSEAHPWMRLSIPGAVGAAIVARGTLQWRGAATVGAALLTIIAGAIAAPLFEGDLFLGSTWPREFMKMVQYAVRFVVWQSATAACLSLGLAGRPPEGPSKSVPPSAGDGVKG